jgi:salicylate hydroxylase
MVQGASDNTTRFHNPALAHSPDAQAFIEREWQQTAIGSRYDWLFTYDAMTVAL